MIRPREEGDKFIIVACDGIWDCDSSEKCVERLSNKIKAIESFEDNTVLSKPLEELLMENIPESRLTEDKRNLNPGTDNMTAVLVYLDQKSEQSPYV